MENLNKQISEVYAAEQKLLNQTKKLIEEVITILGSQQMDGVTAIPGSVQCATVKFSTLANHRTNLSPTYYISDYQTKAIRDKMDSMTSITQLIKFINEAVENGHIMSKTEKILLNPAIMSKLIEIKNMF
jgi:hypothetical protein